MRIEHDVEIYDEGEEEAEYARESPALEAGWLVGPGPIDDNPAFSLACPECGAREGWPCLGLQGGGYPHPPGVLSTGTEMGTCCVHVSRVPKEFWKKWRRREDGLLEEAPSSLLQAGVVGLLGVLLGVGALALKRR